MKEVGYGMREVCYGALAAAQQQTFHPSLATAHATKKKSIHTYTSCGKGCCYYLGGGHLRDIT